MTTLERSCALIAELAEAIGLPEIPRDQTGGWHLTIGGTDDAYIFGGDDHRILLIVPIAPLPAEPRFSMMNLLLRSNMFDSDFMPFQIATDDEATIIQWGYLQISDTDGRALARIIDNLVARAGELRGSLDPPRAPTE
jgi:hypothetical protein